MSVDYCLTRWKNPGSVRSREREWSDVSASDPLLTQDQLALVEGLDALCSRHIDDKLLFDLDQQARYPFDVMQALSDGGWASMAVPESHGGAGASARDMAVVLEELSRHSLVVGQAYFSMWILGAEAVIRLGTNSQANEWLPRIATEGARVAFALTEPGSGSDAAALTTRAEKRGSDYVVTGQKVFTTGAAVADVIITAVRTSRGGTKHAGISTLMIDPQLQGVDIRKIPKMGLKGIDLCEVFFDDVVVPETCLLGELDAGWAGVLPGLAIERLYLAAISVGAMRDVLDLCLEHASTRETFGKALGSHQMIAEKLVEMRVAIETSRALVKQAAEMVDRGDGEAVNLASIAKLHATRSYVSATREAVQIFGGYGFTDEYPVSRHYRDCKYLEIGGGASEIQKIVIARSMGLRP